MTDGDFIALNNHGHFATSFRVFQHLLKLCPVRMDVEILSTITVG